jgi:hypothetical protein
LVEYIWGVNTLHRSTKALCQTLKCQSHLIDIF